MRIVDRKTFLALPSGTLFSKYEPCVFGDLCIKGDTWANCAEFQVQDIIGAIQCMGSSDFSLKLAMAQETGASLDMDFECMGRDGCFDQDQLFAVWEAKDVVALIYRLSGALNDVLTQTPLMGR